MTTSQMSMNLLEPTVWMLVLGVFVCVVVLGLFFHLRAQPQKQHPEDQPK